MKTINHRTLNQLVIDNIEHYFPRKFFQLSSSHQIPYHTSLCPLYPLIHEPSGQLILRNKRQRTVHLFSTPFFSCVLRDSIPRFVRPSVGRSVSRSPFYFFYSFYSFQVILSQLSDFKLNQIILSHFKSFQVILSHFKSIES